MLKQIWIIFSKETTDNLRDRRSVLNTLVSVLFNPVFYIVLFGVMNATLSGQAERPLDLPIIGAEYAPNLVQFLTQNNVNVLPPPDNPVQAIRSGTHSVILVIPESFPEDFKAGRPAVLELMQDESDQGSTVPVRRASRLLSGYGQQIAIQRLLARGISPEIIETFEIRDEDVSVESQGSNGITLSLLPVVMMTAAFFGGFFLLVDMTAGERERKSLEPLLMNPISRTIIVLAKFLAALVFTMLAMLAATLLFTTLLNAPMIQDWTNVRVNLTSRMILSAIGIMLPVAFLATSVEMLFASYAKSFKEAQTYVQLVAIVGFMPSLFLSVLPIRVPELVRQIPTISQLYLIQKISRGEPLAADEVVIASVITLVVGVVALVAALRLYQQERIVIG